MSSKDKSVEKKDRQIAFLADRLALALMMLRHDLHFGIVVLPSRERDRDSLRGDLDFEKITNTVREMLRNEERRDE